MILEFYIDPNVPPLPPHITVKDAANFITIATGEPQLGSVLKNVEGAEGHCAGELIIDFRWARD